MAELPQTRPFVVEDLYEMPDDGFHYELVHGLIVSEPRPGGRHGMVAAIVTEELSRFVRQHRLGVVLTCDTGFILHRAPDTVRGPDVAFIKRERYKSLEDPDKAIPGAPDLAVEVLSPHNRPSEIHGKVADYLAAGTAIVWVIDPAREQVAVYRTLLEPTLLGSEDQLTAEEILPGFRVRVGDLFKI